MKLQYIENTFIFDIPKDSTIVCTLDYFKSFAKYYLEYNYFILTDESNRDYYDYLVECKVHACLLFSVQTLKNVLEINKDRDYYCLEIDLYKELTE